MNAFNVIDETPRERLHRKMRRALATSETRQEAIEALLIACRSDSEAMMVLTEKYQRRAAAELIGNAINRKRAKIWNTEYLDGDADEGRQAIQSAPERASLQPPADENTGATAPEQEASRIAPARATRSPPSAPYTRPAGPDARAAHLARGVAASLMDFPLLDKTPLAEANREKVLETSEHYRKQATNMAWKNRFLRAVAAALPDDAARVRDAMTEAQLRKLHRETQNA